MECLWGRAGVQDSTTMATDRRRGECHLGTTACTQERASAPPGCLRGCPYGWGSKARHGHWATPIQSRRPIMRKATGRNYHTTSHSKKACAVELPGMCTLLLERIWQKWVVLRLFCVCFLGNFWISAGNFSQLCKMSPFSPRFFPQTKICHAK